MFHVEHSKEAARDRDLFHVEQTLLGDWSDCPYLLGLPAMIFRFSVPGIVFRTQCQSEACTAVSASSAPNQRMTRPSPDRAFRDHDKRSSTFPSARDVTNASSFGRILEASNPMERMATSLSSSFRTTSFRKAHFFLFGSSNITLRFGRKSLIAKPGKPAPEPTSASRPCSKLSKDNAKMLSPK